MTAQIKEMDIELDNYHRVTSELELSIADLKLKLRAAEKEIAKEHSNVKNAELVVSRFKADMEDMIVHLPDPKKLKVDFKLISDDSEKVIPQILQKCQRQRCRIETNRHATRIRTSA